jgi:hypothetical protein
MEIEEGSRENLERERDLKSVVKNPRGIAQRLKAEASNSMERDLRRGGP